MAWRIIIAFLLSLIAFALWAATTQTINEPHTLGGEYTTVTNVIDGDTIVVSNDKKVRLIGIDAPELTSSTQSDCFAIESKSRAQQLLLNKQVRLVADISNVDKYERLLRYVYIDDPLSSIHEETSINEILVHEGHAVAKAYPPDTALSETLKELEQKSKEQKFGLWGSCK
ncbi:thermonuclease family protein [Candidatus Kaiserbacteria bacterium]|nr:MAG: thermonuclease family protein [Candidatus Kaiserbacteria bacterium]